jgi:uncharacterized membrane protein (DUF4010 family)
VRAEFVADLVPLWGIAAALLGGLAIGIEREWSGQAHRSHRHGVGIRTFALLGLVSGLSGWLWTAGLHGPATVFLAGVGAIVVLTYRSLSRHDTDGTTEVAAFVVMAAGVLSGAGFIKIGAAVMAVTLLLLVEKRQLHGFVSKIDREELQAGAGFAVMAVIILPLLPKGPYPPYDAIQPRLIWALVVLFSALSFVGYIARRSGAGSGSYAAAGTLGGILSSTSVTLTYSRLSRQDPSVGRALAAGTLGASVMVLPRVLFAAGVLSPALALSLWPYFLAPAAIGIVLALRGARDRGTPHKIPKDRNPLQFIGALQMAGVFQIVLLVAGFAHARFGAEGTRVSAAILGLVDMDALTISMAQQTAAGASTMLAAQAVVIALLSNTLSKLAMTLVIGRGAFRPLAAAGLALTALALVAALMLR